MTTIQDVYTDPQVPNTVETKLYEVGSPDENSPVMFTTNFSLTYFSVEGEVERSKIPAYICVVDTEGLGVLNAYAGDKISAEKVVKTIQEQNIHFIPRSQESCHYLNEFNLCRCWFMPEIFTQESGYVVFQHVWN